MEVPHAYDELSGMEISQDGSPMPWVLSQQAVRRLLVELYPTFDAEPQLATALARPTEGELFYCAFWFRLWPLFATAKSAFVIRRQQASNHAFLASVVRELLGDTPAYLFVQVTCDQCGVHQICLAPRRPSRTRWMMQAARRVSQLDPFTIQVPSTGLAAVCCLVNLNTDPFTLQQPALPPQPQWFAPPASLPTYFDLIPVEAGHAALHQLPIPRTDLEAAAADGLRSPGRSASSGGLSGGEYAFADDGGDSGDALGGDMGDDAASGGEEGCEW
jgi:hypothetical protein